MRRDSQTITRHVPANLPRLPAFIAFASALRAHCPPHHAGAWRHVARSTLQDCMAALIAMTADGSVRAIAPDVLEEWAGWEGTQGAFYTAFLSHWCHGDDAGTMHGWDEHYSALAQQRARKRTQKRLERTDGATSRRPDGDQRATPGRPIGDKPARSRASVAVPGSQTPANTATDRRQLSENGATVAETGDKRATNRATVAETGDSAATAAHVLGVRGGEGGSAVGGGSMDGSLKSNHHHHHQQQPRSELTARAREDGVGCKTVSRVHGTSDGRPTDRPRTDVVPDPPCPTLSTGRPSDVPAAAMLAVVGGEVSAVAGDEVEVVDPANMLHVRRLTIAANQAVTARYGEQPVPFPASGGSALRLAQDLADARVEVAFAVEAIRAAVTAHPDPAPPKAIRYFAGQVLRAWHEELGTRDARTGSHPRDAHPGVHPGDVLMARRFAAEGDPDWIAFCREHNIEFEETQA